MQDSNDEEEPVNALRALTIAALATAAAPAHADRVDRAAPSWDWERAHRYYMEVEVQLPTIMWFTAEFNKEARAVAFRLRTVVSCDPGQPETRRSVEVDCRIDDIGITAAGLRSKTGLLQPIIDELDERLTGGTLQLQIRDDGRIVNVDLDDLDRRNRRVGRMNENLRLIVSRAIAGLDLQLPRRFNGSSSQWVQHANLVMMAPSASGSSGASEVLHQGTRLADGTMEVRSAGRGMVVPQDLMTYEVGYEARAVFDPALGGLQSREWVAIGRPTASSIAAQGFAGIPYVQRGTLRAVAPGEDVDVGPTLEVHPPDGTATTLQLSPVFGLDVR